MPSANGAPKCQRAGCDTLATHAPVVSLRYDLMAAPAVAVLSQLPVCAEHKETTTLDDVIGSDADFERIRTGFAARGLPPPKRMLTTLAWRAIVPNLKEVP